MARPWAPVLSLVLLASGCLGGAGPVPLEDRFMDADVRIAHLSGDDYDGFQNFQVPPGTGAVTLRIGFESEDRIWYTLHDAHGDRQANVIWSTPVRAESMQFVANTAPAEGRWRFGIECDTPCRFVAGVDTHAAVGLLRTPTLERYGDADWRARDAFDHGSTVSQQYSFDLDPSRGDVRLALTLQALEGIRYVLRDARGQTQSSLSFDDRVAVDDLTFQLDTDGQPGQWSLFVECDGRCDYNFGFYRGADPVTVGAG